jgi:putative ATP-dependent endonuclease of the OLD family
VISSLTLPYRQFGGCTWSNGEVKVGFVPERSLTEDEERKIQFHITTTRGELFFARCWLLYEGESEYWILDGLARVTGKELDRWGVRMVPHRFSGHECLLKVANSLGIPWFLFTDGDVQGNATVSGGKAYLNGAEQAERILQIPENTIELHLCASGLGAAFEAHISAQKRRTITEKKGTPEYWSQVLKAKDDTPKPAVIREVVHQIEQGANQPQMLIDVLDAALKLAEA